MLEGYIVYVTQAGCDKVTQEKQIFTPSIFGTKIFYKCYAFIRMFIAFELL